MAFIACHISFSTLQLQLQFSIRVGIHTIPDLHFNSEDYMKKSGGVEGLNGAKIVYEKDLMQTFAISIILDGVPECSNT